MKIHRVFDDLGDFVSAFRGGISREAIRIDLDERHVPGTVLEVDLALADGLSLVHGRAAVVDVRQAPSHAIASWRTVLRFSSLDPDSRDFLTRLEKRQEAEGEPVFRPDIGPPPAELEVRGDDMPNLTDTGALEVAFRDMSRRPTVRERAAPVEERGEQPGDGARGGRVGRFVLGVALLAAVVVAAWFGLETFAPGLLGFGGEESAPSRVETARPSVTPTPSPSPAPTATAPAEPPTTAPAEPPATATASAPTAGGRPRVTGVEWSVEEGVTVVRLTADRDLRTTAVRRFRMDDDPAPRELLVMRDVGADDLPVRQSLESPQVIGIRTWLHDDRSPPELHVVLDLVGSEVSADEPVVDGRTVTVRLR